MSKCPICKTDGFETTMYKKEGGYCKKCCCWVVPQSSFSGISNAVEGGGLKITAKIQFHKKGIPTFTWLQQLKKWEKEK